MNDNTINVIYPHKKKGIWVFTDDNTGLVDEAFVAGIPEIIVELTKDISNPEDGFALLFSPLFFPGSTGLNKVDRPNAGPGTWYYCPKTNSEGWLCPALFKYYPEAPEHLYAKAEEMEKVA